MITTFLMKCMMSISYRLIGYIKTDSMRSDKKQLQIPKGAE